MRLRIIAAMMLSLFVPRASVAAVPMIDGRVVDEKGSPVANASIDYFWRANGPVSDQNGKAIDPATAEGNKLFWGHLGQMQPFRTAKSGADGRFSIERPNNFHAIMAMDAQRVCGGLADIPKDNAAQIEIRLHPLIRVVGRFEGPTIGQRPAWTHVFAQVPEDPTRPLDTDRLVSCGSHEARFAMCLPPGRYVLDANDDTQLELNKEIVLKGDKPEVDLGVLLLTRKTRQNINEKIKISQASGVMGDYTKHYGEKLPEWHIVDARGVSKNVQLSDFKGKWVLVKFWGLNCGSCLGHDLPNLAKFYRDHEHQRSQFEILAVCVDCDEKMRSIADVDRELEPIVKYVWQKPLPFPILLDPSMTTLEVYGVPGYETILIDPDGKLVKGDETTLGDALNR